MEPRIVIVSPQLPPDRPGAGFRGGIERLVASYAGGLREVGVRTTLVSVDYFAVAAAGGRIVPARAPDASRVQLPAGADLVEELRSLTGGYPCALVVFVDNGGPFSRPTVEEIGALADRLAGEMPFVLGLPFPRQEIDFYSRDDERRSFLDSLSAAARAATAVLYPSRWCRDSYRGLFLGTEQIVVVPGVEPVPPVPPGHRPLGDEIAVVARGGMWAIHKNHVPLLEAVARLHPRRRVVVHVVGPHTEFLAPIARLLGIEDQVVLHGLVAEEQRHALLSRVTAHVLPSAIEAFGFAFAEALAAGIPTVCCSDTAVPELGPAGIHACAPRHPSRFAAGWGFWSGPERHALPRQSERLGSGSRLSTLPVTAAPAAARIPCAEHAATARAGDDGAVRGGAGAPADVPGPHCDACNRDDVVAFSCKRRGFCPSCGARRMAATAAHLVDSVIPDIAPIRQWVLSLPHRLRYLCAYDPETCAAVRRILVRAVSSLYRRRARRLGLPRPSPGAVVFEQRFDSGLRMKGVAPVLSGGPGKGGRAGRGLQ